MIYADNAATTKLDVDAFEAMKPFLLDNFANPSQPYSFSRPAKDAMSAARQTIAECIHAKPEEIFFTSGGTESDNWAIKGVAFAHSKEQELITSAFEHHALLRSAEAIGEQLHPVVYVQPDKSGIVQPKKLQAVITDKTAMVSVMTANNEIGTVQPVQELCTIAHQHGAMFHTDAVQAVGHIPINVEDMGIDLLSASAHKFNGPKGMGFLYIRNGSRIAPNVNGGSQESGMRAGTENVAAIVGMAEALWGNCMKMNENRKHISELEDRLLSGLRQLPISFHRNGAEPLLPGILSLSFPGFDGEAILHRMDLMGIAISTGAACDSVNTAISHVLRAIQLDERAAKGTVRISLGKDNSAEDVDAIVHGLAKILLKTRS
jgi:cysteine desulfurase